MQQVLLSGATRVHAMHTQEFEARGVQGGELKQKKSAMRMRV
jgi:hypothetical protein